MISLQFRYVLYCILFGVVLLPISTSAQFDTKGKMGFSLMRDAQISDNKSKLTHLYLRGDMEQIKPLIEGLGGRYKRQVNDMHAVAIAMNKVPALASSNAVTQIIYNPGKGHILSDSMLINNNIIPVHNGDAPLLGTYTGKGVIVGIVDTGLEFNHPDFTNMDGSTRIKYLWDQTINAPTSPPFPFNYGQEWDSTDINNGVVTQGAQSHGTAVTSIAAGNGSAIGKYKGGAPSADIIFVKTDLYANGWASTVVDAVEYVFLKADIEGKPAVVNLSIGQAWGSHDGNDPDAQAMDAIITSENGRAVTCAAGNWGQYENWHLGYDVTTDTSFTYFEHSAGTVIPGYMPNGGVYLQIWADTADFNGIDFSMGIDKVGGNYSHRGHADFINIQDYLSGIYFSSIDQNGVYTDAIRNENNDILGYMHVYAAPMYNNSVYEIEILFDPDSVSNYLFSFMTEGEGHFDLWSSENSIMGISAMVQEDDIPDVASYPAIVNYQAPDSLQCLADNWACSPNVITVGNYVNRAGYYDIDSVLQLTGYPRGLIYPASSRGPTRNGLVKPDVSAPGNVTIAAGVPSLLAIDSVSNPWAVVAGGYHRESKGTSMSAPSVAGVVALLFERCPKFSYQDIYQLITSTARSDIFTGSVPNPVYGYGKADAFEAMKATMYFPELENGGVLSCTNPLDINLTQIFTNYEWSTGDNTPLLYVTETGSYHVAVTNVDGCLGISDTVYVIIEDTIPQAQISIVGSASICEGDSVLLQIPDTFASYLWSNGSITDFSYAPTTSFYWGSATDDIGCVNYMDSVMIVVNNNPTIPVVSIGGNGLISTISNDYQWYFNDSLITDSVAQSITVFDAGYYYVESIHANGCSVFSDSIYVDLSSVEDANVFSKELIVYPNPTSGIININLEHEEDGQLSIYNSLGQEIYSESIQSKQRGLKIDFSQETKGAYILYFRSTATTITQKIMVN